RKPASRLDLQQLTEHRQSHTAAFNRLPRAFAAQPAKRRDYGEESVQRQEYLVLYEDQCARDHLHSSKRLAYWASTYRDIFTFCVNIGHRSHLLGIRHVKLRTSFGLLLSTLLLAACATKSGVQLDTERHLTAPQAQSEAAATRDIPAPVQQGYSLPPPRQQAKPETYSVVVNNVRVQDLLFSLARDAKVNVDIHPGLVGSVTMNALDQTLPQLLTRIAKQVDMRFEFDGSNLTVMPDSPFLRTYRIDYVNMSRDTAGSVAVSNQIATAGNSNAGNSSNGVSGSGSTGNSSSTVITNTAHNHFWDTLIQNMKDILRETDKIFPDGAAEKTVETTTQGGTTTTSIRASKPDDILSRNADTEKKSTQVEKTVTFREAASIIANPEAGVVSIRATARQHEKVQEFLSQVMNSARRQVLIEATIAEVELSQNYQQGIDWKALNVFGTGLRVIQSVAGAIANPSATLLEVGYNSDGGNFTSSLKFLESFGNVKVLSSPKISVLNNQTAVLKVVDNLVYFTIDVSIARGTNNQADIPTYTSNVHTVPIGLVMNVTPQIGESNTVLLNLRPTLSRTIGPGISDPNPLLKPLNIDNRIPIVRSREIESVMRVNSGNIAVMGGLMEDLLNNTDDTVPGLSRSPIFGGLFENRNDTKSKTELVIFIRPTVIHDGDTSVDVNDMPRSTFFDIPPGMPGPATLGGGR
ncbi:MAG: MSHA-type pilus biosis protein MshL, partial [Rhodocyclales bacterium]|nr:MSHA-type pilus biosis protein MshL [Rhodocyclales bacterium]